MIGISVNDNERGPLPRDYDGLLFWYRSDLDINNGSGGAAVRSWGDNSANGLTAGQLIAARRPAYGAGPANLPAVQFDGVDDDLFNSAITAPAGGSYTLLTCCKSNGAEGAIVSIRNGLTIMFTHGRVVLQPETSIPNSAQFGSGGTVGQYAVLAGQHEDATRSIYLNGAVQATNSNAHVLPSPTRLRLGKQEPALITELDGEILELAAWTPKISDADLLRLTEWMMLRYGIA